MACQRSRLGADALHQIAVGNQRICIMIDDRKTWFVVMRRQMFLGDGESHAHGESLSERPGCGFHAGCHPKLGMSRRPGFPLTEFFQILNRQIITKRV